MGSFKNHTMLSSQLKLKVRSLMSAKKDKTQANLFYGMAMEHKTNNLLLNKKDLTTISSVRKEDNI